MRGRVVIACVPLVGAVALTGCGIATGDDSFREIPAQEIPFDLDEPSTTTSSTTPPTTSIPVAPQTTGLETTTTIAPLDEVDIFFLARGRLQPVAASVARNYGADQVITVLEDGPRSLGPAGNGLTSLIAPGLITSSEVAGGVITVDLDPDVFRRIASSDQSEAIGQIVLTLTSNVPRVGLVRFTLGGEATQVKKGNGTLSEPDEPVSFDDYVVLLAQSTPSATTSTTTTVAPTSVAPETTPPAVDSVVDTTIDPAAETTVPG